MDCNGVAIIYPKGNVLVDPMAMCSHDLAKESIQKLADLPGIEAIIVGDGWPCFSQGGRLIQLLLSD